MILDVVVHVAGCLAAAGRCWCRECVRGLPLRVNECDLHHYNEMITKWLQTRNCGGNVDVSWGVSGFLGFAEAGNTDFVKVT